MYAVADDWVGVSPKLQLFLVCSGLYLSKVVQGRNSEQVTESWATEVH